MIDDLMERPVDLRKDDTLPLTCKNCRAAWDDYVCSFNRLPISWLEKDPDWTTPYGRFDDCPANESDIMQRLAAFREYLCKRKPPMPLNDFYYIPVQEAIEADVEMFDKTFPEVE